ncbi:MAG: hybrid sensor histidine kinase/response regulator transcription factor [Jejuia sp.]
MAIFTYISVCGTSVNAQSKDLKFEHFIDDKGFSQHLVMKVIQDLDGYIWVGTLNGLYKYDGQKFIAYKHEINNPNSLVSNLIYELELDVNGNILIGTGKGLTKYDRLTQKFITYPAALKNARISAICPMSNGDLWVGTSHSGLFYFKSEDTKGEYPVQYLHKPNTESSISSNQIHSLVKDGAENIWIGTLKGLNRLIDANGVKEFVRFKEIDKSIKALLVDSTGALFVGTVGHRLLKVNTPEKYTKPNLIEYVEYSFDLKNSDTAESGGIITMYEGSDENLFVGIHGYGLYLLNKKTREHTNYIHDARVVESISSNNIESILVDRTGVLWVGTEGGGLNKCDLKQKPIAHFEHNMLSDNSLSNSLINCIAKENDSTFWIGTQDGLNQVKFTNSTYNNPVFKRFYRGDKTITSQLKSEENVWSVLKDSDGDYWMGGVNSVVRIQKNDRNKTLSFERTDFNMLEVSSIIEDTKGNIWFGSMINGLIKWPKQKLANGLFNYSNHIHYLPDAGDRYSISTKEVSCLYQDSKENIWVGTLRGGLNLIVPGGKNDRDQFVAFQNDANNANSLSHNSVFSILEDRNGIFWIGTYGGGLNKMILPSGGNSEPIFKHYTEKDGLVNNVIYGILEDDEGLLWISTDNGISSFNPKTEEFKNFKKEDGLKGNNFRPGAYFKNDDGYLFFGGYKGLNIFNPKALKENDILAPVVLTGLKIKDEVVKIGETYNGRVILDKNLSNISEPITLHHDENTITIDFAALHYAAPEKNQYKYQLEGFNKDWIPSQSSTFAHYTNLSPGSYTFKVKASNNDGVWNDEATILKFKIKPPFWLSWWAYLIYALGLIAIFWGIQSYFHLRSQQRASKQIQQEIEHVNKLKLKFFTNISHEFKTPITLILSPIEELMESFSNNEIVQSKLKIVQRNANSLLRLVNQLMEFRRIEVGETTLSASKANVVSFIKEIALSFQVPAKKKDIVVSFECSLNTLPVWFDWDKLEKIMNNLIYNAIKFTTAGGEIKVRIIKSPINQEIEIAKRAVRTEYVEISIEDTGIGIDKDKLPYVFQRFYQVNQSKRLPQKGSGIGLALTKDLVDLHYGEIHVNSEKGIGSVFKIKLPLGKKHLLPEEILDLQKPIEVINEEREDTELLSTEESVFNDNDALDKTKNKILVVDDNPDIRLFVKNGLSEKYRILEADNGKMALNTTLKEMPDLVITDVLMPEMDGVELTSKLKNNVRTSHIPVIMLTALNSVEHRINGLEAGADAYIPKPFRMKLLSTRVNKLIASRELMKRRFQTEKELTPDYVTLNSVDETFLKQIMEHMEENMANEQYWVDELAADMNTSRSTFFRKLKSLTGQAPNDFMRIVRLKRAVQLLEQNELTIAQVSYMVGFRHPNYFGKCFRKFFGVSPSNYIKEKEKV